MLENFKGSLSLSFDIPNVVYTYKKNFYIPYTICAINVNLVQCIPVTAFMSPRTNKNLYILSVAKKRKKNSVETSCFMNQFLIRLIKFKIIKMFSKESSTKKYFISHNTCIPLNFSFTSNKLETSLAFIHFNFFIENRKIVIFQLIK